LPNNTARRATLISALIDGSTDGCQHPTDTDAVKVVELEPQAMLDAAVAGELQAMTPDSSVWLPQLDALWAAHTGDDRAFIVGQTVYYAVSPVVIAMWRDVALELGYGSRPLGWADLLARARVLQFQWAIPSISPVCGGMAVFTPAPIRPGVDGADVRPRPRSVWAHRARGALRREVLLPNVWCRGRAIWTLCLPGATGGLGQSARG
jgi:hypothetical protein